MFVEIAFSGEYVSEGFCANRELLFDSNSDNVFKALFKKLLNFGFNGLEFDDVL